MKKQLYLYLFIGIILTSGCGKYGYVRIKYPQSPDVYIPSHIQKIAVVNRSLTHENDKSNKIVEAIMTAEIGGSDVYASDECVRGVVAGMTGVRDIELMIPANSQMYGSGTGTTPGPLNWDSVAHICEVNNVDALLVLESFDSNTDLLMSTATNQVNAILNNRPPVPTPPSQITMSVISYWRLYDPESNGFVDQFQFTHTSSFNTGGGPLPIDALPKAAYESGQEYAYRYWPGQYTLRRDLYKKGKGRTKSEFVRGFRRTEVANWQEAIEIWEALIPLSNETTAGRACLNIAVAYEVLGQTEEALKWAKRSYTDYNDKLGRDYAKTLLKRQQLENWE